MHIPSNVPNHQPEVPYIHGKWTECVLTQHIDDVSATASIYRLYILMGDNFQYAYYPMHTLPNSNANPIQIFQVLEKTDTNNNDGSPNSYVWTDRVVAIKVYSSTINRVGELEPNSLILDGWKEASVMQIISKAKSNNENLMGTEAVIFDGNNLYIVMQYCERGDLRTLINQRSLESNITEVEVRKLFYKIVKAVQNLHTLGLCHRDLSPENILISNDGNPILADFGKALQMKRRVVESMKANGKGRLQFCTVPFTPQGKCGKDWYMPPEIYRNDFFDGVAVDVWSLGTILFVMISVQRPYKKPHRSDFEFLELTTNLDEKLRRLNLNVSPELVDLLRCTLQVDPEQRLTLKEILAHRWFAL